MRQEAVAKLTTLLANKQIVNTPAVAELAGLLKKKVRVENNAAMGEVMIALKNRLGETNLNLRARVVQCIDALVKALNGQAVEFAALLLPELMKLTGDSKSSVVDAV